MIRTRTSAPANLEVRRIDPAMLEVRVADDVGTFEGLSLLWNTVDSYGTQFTRGSFGVGGLDALPYALLWMHDPFTVLGTFVAEEREAGLWIAGSYDATPDGAAGRARALSRSAAELSVGFTTTAVSPDDSNVITGARLVEVSQITARMAAVPGAALTGVRGAAAAAEAAAEAATAGLRRSAEAAAARLRLSMPNLDR